MSLEVTLLRIFTWSFLTCRVLEIALGIRNLCIDLRACSICWRSFCGCWRSIRFTSLATRWVRHWQA